MKEGREKMNDFDNITFKQIEVFLAVASHKSFSSAASSLFLHQSSVSRNIKSLEDALGLQLFERDDKGAVLTPAGQILYRELASLMGGFGEAVSLARQGDTAEEQRIINVACLRHSEVERHARRFIAAYQSQHPDIKFNLEQLNFAELRESLIYGHQDCIITFGIGFGLLRNIRKASIRRVDSYFAISSAHPMLLHRELDMRCLAISTLYLISGAEMQQPEERAVNICRQYGFEPKAVRYEPSRHNVELAVKNGLGFTIDGLDFSKRYPKEIAMFKISKPIEDQTIIIAWRENNCPEMAKDFIDYTLSSAGS